MIKWIERNSSRIIVAAIVLSFVAGGWIAIHAGSNLRYYDEREYVLLASNLVSKHIYSYDGAHATAFHAPGYAFFLALPTALGIGKTGMRLINLSMFLCSELLLVLLARRLYSRSCAAIAVLLVLFYPVLLYAATLLYPQTFGATLFLLGIWLLIRDENLSKKSTLFAGIVWGVLILTIPTFIFVLGCYVAWLLWKRPAFRHKVLVFTTPLILLVGAWVARDYRQFHSLFFVATCSGINLMQGSSEKYGYQYLPKTELISDAVQKMPEVEQNRFITTTFLDWIKGHPQAALRLYGMRLAGYFTFTEKTATENFATQAEKPFWRTIIMLCTWGPLLLLFLVRIALFRRWPLSEVEILLAGLYMANVPFTAMFFPRIRHRLPMDWILLLLDAGMVQIILSCVFSRNKAVRGER